MTRTPATVRYTIDGTLVAETAVRVGGLSWGAAIDLPILRDGLDRPAIPGTALAGVLRSDPDDPAAADLWGGGPYEGDLGATRISLVVIDDAPLETAFDPGPAEGKPVGRSESGAPPPSGSDLRDHVSLNRFTRTAEPGFLFTEESLPAGSRFLFHCTVDVPERHDPAHKPHPDVAGIVGRLLAGVRVGGGSSSGLGHVRLHHPPTVSYRRLSSRADLEALLEGRPTRYPALGIPAPRAESLIEVAWAAKGPVLVADSPHGSAVDVVPLVARRGEEVRLLLPGSSIKGSLRSHAELILRSVLRADSRDRPSDGSWPKDRRDLHKLDLSATDRRTGLVGLLFGTAGDNRADSSAAGAEHGRRGAIRVEDCLSTRSWPARAWAEVLNADRVESTGNSELRPQQQLLDALAELAADDGTGAAPFLIGDHVAIDRWTGGAADGALYSVLEPWLTAAGDWSPLRLRIDPGMLDPALLGQDTVAAAQALLALTLVDFCAGWIPLGYGAAKGYGCVREAVATWDATPLEDVLHPLLSAWQEWITK